VANSDAMIEESKKCSITVTGTADAIEYGEFVHITDIRKNKFEW
jgi:hypothetical protein